ncbi:MAG: hypothetical protein S4CHLAM2_12800 [Chlamydiales bacterium]|nr:hypothetical protein [Chlamydiales bacterium]
MHALQYYPTICSEPFFCSAAAAGKPIAYVVGERVLAPILEGMATSWQWLGVRLSDAFNFQVLPGAWAKETPTDENTAYDFCNRIPQKQAPLPQAPVWKNLATSVSVCVDTIFSFLDDIFLSDERQLYALGRQIHTMGAPTTILSKLVKPPKMSWYRRNVALHREMGFPGTFFDQMKVVVHTHLHFIQAVGYTPIAPKKPYYRRSFDLYRALIHLYENYSLLLAKQIEEEHATTNRIIQGELPFSRKSEISVQKAWTLADQDLAHFKQQMAELKHIIRAPEQMLSDKELRVQGAVMLAIGMFENVIDSAVTTAQLQLNSIRRLSATQDVEDLQGALFEAHATWVHLQMQVAVIRYVYKEIAKIFTNYFTLKGAANHLTGLMAQSNACMEKGNCPFLSEALPEPEALLSDLPKRAKKRKLFEPEKAFP